MLVIWNERAKPRCERAGAESAVMSSPAKRTRPRSGTRSPASWPISVVLPAVRPDDRVRLAFQHFEVDAVAREQCAEALGEAADFEQDLIHSCRRAVPRG